jgi:hypothetical protein
MQLLKVMRDPAQPLPIRIEAAAQALFYEYRILDLVTASKNVIHIDRGIFLRGMKRRVKGEAKRALPNLCACATLNLLIDQSPPGLFIKTDFKKAD